MRERRLYKQNRKKKRKQIWRVKCCLSCMAIAVCLLMIYIVLTLVSLIVNSIEYSKADVGNQVVQEALVNLNESTDAPSQENDIESTKDKTMQKIEEFAAANNLSVEEYPTELIALLEKNPETEEFVLNYPFKKNTHTTDALNECLNDVQVPLFLQWDSRWGYYNYGNQPMGLTGCGPTCLSMVALHLLQNPQMTPVYVADFSQRNGFYVDGTGTSWALMTQGAAELGLYAQEVSLDEELVLRHLRQGRPIICAMGPGDFTELGHFIVFVGVEDGKIVVNDPNSKVRSEMLWNFEDIKYQIKNMWAYSVSNLR